MLYELHLSRITCYMSCICAGLLIYELQLCGVIFVCAATVQVVNSMLRIYAWLYYSVWHTFCMMMIYWFHDLDQHRKFICDLVQWLCLLIKPMNSPALANPFNMFSQVIDESAIEYMCWRLGKWKSLWINLDSDNLFRG